MKLGETARHGSVVIPHLPLFDALSGLRSTPPRVLEGNSLETLQGLQPQSVHCCTTSPPYYALRDYGVPPSPWPEVTYRRMLGTPEITLPPQTCCLGLEQEPASYIGHLVAVFRQVRRVLQDDGTCWIVIGDSYCNTNGYARCKGQYHRAGRDNAPANDRDLSALHSCGYKTKDLLGIPWLLALALQADGWYLRGEAIWSKPNPMPETVFDRCSRAHENVFLFTKCERYYFDSVAVEEPAAPGREDGLISRCSKRLRSVWTIPTCSCQGDHFAVFPPDLAALPILAGTSAAGCCPACGAGWKRIVDSQSTVGWRPGCACYGLPLVGDPPRRPKRGKGESNAAYAGRVRGWLNKSARWHAEWARLEPTYAVSPRTPAVVIDPFAGAGTTGQVATHLGRRAILCELQPDYARLIKKRCAEPPKLCLSQASRATAIRRGEHVGGEGASHPVPL